MSTLRLILTTSLCLLLLGARQPAHAQGRGRPAAPGGRITQLDNAKIAFITSRLTLSQDQAQRFWPMYNDFVGKRRELNRSARLLRRDANNPGLSEAQLRDNFTQDFTIRQQQLNLEKDYFERAQKVLTLRQLAQLYQAERDFTKEVLRRVAGPNAAPPAAD
ncbi:hypothetical protein QMK33_17605 [Hymenobacter sp. H14-R3]|uniref:hypothetical protein n=1 Tax=Hymenobacter sp. H14-R3 TaxID=3046308 RepID=UPI0024B9A105|nr:hypothetical protein [Hymenobacter sp. H14-R3]MDJ0366970.1 hypothetical protein [Hymenobacter sp. H14-R3]